MTETDTIEFVRFGHSPGVSFRAGVVTSLLLHFFLGAIVIFVLERTAADASGAQQVFSVTLEGGMNLGGISQVPKDGGKKILTPQQNREVEKPDEPKAKEVTKKSEPQVKDPVEKTPPPEEKPQKELTQPSVVEDPAKILAEKKALEEKQRKEEEKQKLKEKQEKEKKKKEEEKKKEEQERVSKEKEREARDKAIDRAARRVQNQYEGESAAAGGDGFGAAKLGGQGMGGGTLGSLEEIAYRNALTSHVKRGWSWLGGSDRLVANVRVRILQNGQIQDVKVESSSGNRNFDDSVVRAVYKASPVPPPPPDLYSRFSDVRFNFDSKEVRQ